MSRRRLVPVDPEQQPPIRTFIAECKKAGLTGVTGRRLATKVLNKKCHPSTEDKKSSVKRKPTSSLKSCESIPKSSKSIPTNSDSIPEISNKMATIVVNQEVKDPTVIAIEGMESRLKATMKENREKEIAEMEARLKNNMREVIETSIQWAINTMGSKIHQMIAINPIVSKTNKEVDELKQENVKLKQELQYLSAEHGKLESRMERIENRNLENSVII